MRLGAGTCANGHSEGGVLMRHRRALSVCLATEQLEHRYLLSTSPTGGNLDSPGQAPDHAAAASYLILAEGELTEREKALIVLAVAHAVQCPYCIDAYTQGCLDKGSNLAEMTEAVHVVTAIRGGASLVHGVQMRNIAHKISM